MIVRLSNPLRLSLRTALVLALAAVGFTAFTATASAHFTLAKGTTITLEDGSGFGTPPTLGSYVDLPKDGGGFFENPTTTAESEDYTLINGSGATVGLELGVAQPGNEIFGPLTAFAGPDFYAFTKLAPYLTFSGNGEEFGVHNLIRGKLPLWIEWNSGEYDADTRTGSPTAKYVIPLTGTLVGDAAGGEVTLDWETHLYEPGFEKYAAQFHLVGTF